MKRISFLVLVLSAFLTLFSQKTNVVVVLADDIGLGDISYYRSLSKGDIIVETPNIDKLAKGGMAFTNAHAPAALCAPSRYAIMTGNSCYRSDFPWGVWGAYEKSPIKEGQLTLGKLMKQAGYKTAFFGKWHLGGDWFRRGDSTKIYRGPRNQPETDVDIHKIVGGGPQFQGFDYSYTYPAGIQDVPYASYENGKWSRLKNNSEITYISQSNMDKIGVKLDKMEGLGDSNWDPHQSAPVLVHKALDFIKRTAHKDTPFFMYYCSQAVHLPHTPPKSLNGIEIAGTTPTKHLDMVKELDVQMGMLVDELKEQGVYENTVFIFTSDNGGLIRKETLAAGHKPSDIYRGGKNQIYEGGHRVPFIVVWPKKVKPGQKCEEPVLGLDIMATLASITNVKIARDQAMDSKSLLPILKGNEKAKGHSFLMVQGGTSKEVAIIEDEWKLIIQIDKKDKSDRTRYPKALYNLKNNPEEQESKNLINSPEHKIIVNQLFKKYNSVRDEKKRVDF